MTRPLSKVGTYDAEIRAAAAATGVEANLIRAVMHYESGVGGPKDLIAGPLGQDQTIQPMNVGRQWAGRYGLSVLDLRNPATNVLIGARILSGIQANLGPSPSVAEIYTLYNQLDAPRVSWRGVAVQRIYENQLWAK